jgi:hypothetical protein
MRYRKKVRADVMAELTAHFEDELRDCRTDEEKEQKAQRLITDFGDVKLLAVLLRPSQKTLPTAMAHCCCQDISNHRRFDFMLYCLLYLYLAWETYHKCQLC